MLRTGQSPAPSQGRSSSASTPGSRPTPGVLLPGTLASPRAGLAPAGCRELVARLRRGVLLSVVLGARAAGRTFRRNHQVLGARGRPAWLQPPRGAAWTPTRAAGPGSRAAAGGPAGTPRALDAARSRRGSWPGGRDNGRSASGCRGPDAASAPPARPFQDPTAEIRHGYWHLQVAFEKLQAVTECLVDTAENPPKVYYCPRTISGRG